MPDEPHQLSHDLTIHPGSGAQVCFRGLDSACNAIFVQLPDDVAPYFSIDKILVGGREISNPSPGSLISTADDDAGDVVVLVWNTSDQARDFRAILWTWLRNGSMAAQATGWSGEYGFRDLASWMGSTRSGSGAGTGSTGN